MVMHMDQQRAPEPYTRPHRTGRGCPDLRSQSLAFTGWSTKLPEVGEEDAPWTAHTLSPPCVPTGETFLPYYTGRAIDGIVIQKSMEQFSTAVVIMCLLAIGR